MEQLTSASILLSRSIINIDNLQTNSLSLSNEQRPRKSLYHFGKPSLQKSENNYEKINDNNTNTVNNGAIISSIDNIDLHMDISLDKEKETHHTEQMSNAENQEKRQTTPTIKQVAAMSSIRNNLPVWKRIERDLQSPSATVKMRAIRGLAEPEKYGYTMFDAPVAEQSLFVQDSDMTNVNNAMKNIVVYVDVRSGKENCSLGVRQVIADLGIRVNASLLKDTTHVIFKDGLLSTYKKAKQMNIPIVSILWIEACKAHRRICDPRDYPIYNIDRYENPELYMKMRRLKSAQSNTKCNKHINQETDILYQTKGASDAANTQNLESIVQNSDIISDTTKTCSNKRKEVDIRHYFKNISNEVPMESPLTQFLDKPGTRVFNEAIEPSPHNARKALNFIENDDQNQEHDNHQIVSDSSVKKLNETSSKIIIDNSKNANKQLIQETTIDTTTDSLKRMSISHGNLAKIGDNNPTAETKCEKMPIRKLRENRKSKRMTLDNHSISNIKYNINGEEVFSEENETMKYSDNNASKALLPKLRRRTTYSIKSMDTSKMEKNKVENSNDTSITVESTKDDMKRSRRILHKTKPIGLVLTKEENTGQTILTTPKNASDTTNSGSKESEMSEITKKSNTFVKATSPVKEKSSRRRTLYTPKNMDLTCRPTKIAIIKPISRNLKYEGVCTTPPCVSKELSSLCATKALAEASPVEQSIYMVPSSSSISSAETVVEVNSVIENTATTCTIPLLDLTQSPDDKSHTILNTPTVVLTNQPKPINQTKSSADLLQHSSVKNSTENVNINTTDNQLKNVKDDRHENTICSSPRNNSDKMKNQHILCEFDKGVSVMKASSYKKSQKELTSKATSEGIASKQPTLSKSSPKKRARRTLKGKPHATKPLIKPKISSLRSTDKSRRSTLDFQNVACKIIPSKEDDCTDNKSKDSKNTVSGITSNKKDLKKTNCALPVLSYTNMTNAKVHAINEAVSIMGGTCLNRIINDDCTHVVSSSSRRTLNLLRALIRGLWIVSYNWVLDSLNAGYWLAEEGYELRNFSRAIKICRSERQAFGPSYRSELFHNFGSFYVTSECHPISRDDTIELILLSGGNVVERMQDAQYVIGDLTIECQNLKRKIYVSTYWLLDSITEMEILKKMRTAGSFSSSFSVYRLFMLAHCNGHFFYEVSLGITCNYGRRANRCSCKSLREKLYNDNEDYIDD